MKKIITIAIIIIIVIIFAIFMKNNYKLSKSGNNMSNKSADEIQKYILGINSYEAVSNITVESNKNTSNYLVKEQYTREGNISKLEIMEPENINGVVFLYDGINLSIKNTNLNLNKIYENYQYIGENTNTLMSFINDYLESSESKCEENGEEIILETKVKNGNKYISHKKLFINKKTATPTKLEIKDITQKTVIYILYNEIKMNNLQGEDILAFKLDEFTNDI